MTLDPRTLLARASRLLPPVLGAILLFFVAVLTLRHDVHQGYADPIPPPEGYPKLSLSLKTVTPTLAGSGGVTLTYEVAIRNTGAYTATDVSFSDTLPAGVTYLPALAAVSEGPPLAFDGSTVTWLGDVGFDATTILTFGVRVDPAYTGTVRNTALIEQAEIAAPVTVVAETVVTDEPYFAIGKRAEPAKPGANKALTYTLVVTNLGQRAESVPLTVTDRVPAQTALLALGADGSTDVDEQTVTWNRPVTLDPGETTAFTFSVTVDDVLSGTVISNDEYGVLSAETEFVAGEPYTTTVVDPIFTLFKEVAPEPPGANREMTYTLTVFNQGSLATGLVITDRVPAGVEYASGGTPQDDVVSWEWPALDTGETAQFTYSVLITDVANYYVSNDDYRVCSLEAVCAPGIPITSFVRPATFSVDIELDPIAKGPGSGTKPVTPTIVIHNQGPGTAIGASALLHFERINVQQDEILIEPSGSSVGPAIKCGDKCLEFWWTGDIGYGEAITLTAPDQNSQGGEEGTNYTATVVISDELSNMATAPLTATAVGTVTHYPNLVPTKRAPSVIGRGQIMTYTFEVWNSGLSANDTPYPFLVDTVPPSTTLVSISDLGESQVVGGSTVVSWTLPAMSTGERVYRSYAVEVDDDLISGTQLVNWDYYAGWYTGTTLLTNTGKPVTTTVVEAGLIDSYKEVTPALARPGPDNTFTYTIHVVNSGPLPLTDVTVEDLLPWANSTYQRDAVASAGNVISDIVSVHWTGDVGAFSEETITLTVVADPGFEGTLSNTAVISHAGLLQPVEVGTVAYVTEDPVLQISKRAGRDPVPAGERLRYTIRVVNAGQQATALLITDTVPAGTTYVPGSASAGGTFAGGVVAWHTPVLHAGEARTYQFEVSVGNGREVVNEFYGVRSAEGARAVGTPLVTRIRGGSSGHVYLPVIMRR